MLFSLVFNHGSFPVSHYATIPHVPIAGLRRRNHSGQDIELEADPGMLSDQFILFALQSAVEIEDAVSVAETEWHDGWGVPVEEGQPADTGLGYDGFDGVFFHGRHDLITVIPPVRHGTGASALGKWPEMPGQRLPAAGIRRPCGQPIPSFDPSKKLRFSGTPSDGDNGSSESVYRSADRL